MFTLLIVGWFLLGFISFISLCLVVAREITLADLIAALVAGCFGPIMLIVIAAVVLLELHDSKMGKVTIFKLK
jgi:hypothetical protein